MAEPFQPPSGSPRSQAVGGDLSAIALQRLVDASQQTNVLLGSIQQALGLVEQDLARLTGNIGANYAEGVWTPALSFGGSSLGIAYSTQSGTYEITGRNVSCRFRIALTSKGSASGSAVISGLPATSNVSLANDGSGGLCVVYSNMASLTGVPLISVGAASSNASLLSAGAAATVALTDANFSNASVLNGSFSFFT